MSNYPYSQAVGNLMHAIVNSRPDCAYTVTNLVNTCPIHDILIGKVLKESYNILMAFSILVLNINAAKVAIFYKVFKCQLDRQIEIIAA